MYLQEEGSKLFIQFNYYYNQLSSNKSKENGDNTIILIEKLSKHYGKGGLIKALDELDLEIFEGETFGLLGPNGAGKTTTVRLLNCIIKPTSGTAIVKGFDINKNSMEVKRITGLLAESPGLYEKLSSQEFLEFMGALYDVPEEILPNRIVELLNIFGLYKRRNHLIEGYSQGMKQKLLIAAALIHDPPILFLDEPTSMLDPRAALIVKDLIKGLSEKAGTTIFICSHILPIVEELCDRIGIINDGKLIALGSVSEIISNTGTNTLEDAFISLTGGVEEKELLSWREQKITNS